MDFRLNDDQRALQDAARRFAQAELPALARELEEAGEPLPDAWVKRYAELGFLGINLPTSLGGQGLSHLDAALVLEEFARISGAVALPIFESCFGPTLAIARHADRKSVV
jgi:butyryl-CoA dehydrogenase